jgi:cytoskeletal protein CcmA (bactofilin family)
VDIRDNGSVDGDLSAPRVAIADGAHFRGSIDMQRQGAGAAAKPGDAKHADAKPEPKPTPAPAHAGAGTPVR